MKNTVSFSLTTSAGWWRERPHLGKLESKARYSLIISIETPDQKNDLYHAIENMATVTTEVLHR